MSLSIKILISLITFFILIYSSFGQGETAEGALISQAEDTWISNIETLELNQLTENINLPSEVDNTDEDYWRDHWLNQGGNHMCASAAITYFCFTYEMNRLTHIAAKITKNQ